MADLTTFSLLAPETTVRFLIRGSDTNVTAEAFQSSSYYFFPSKSQREESRKQQQTSVRGADRCHIWILRRLFFISVADLLISSANDLIKMRPRHFFNDCNAWEHPAKQPRRKSHHTWFISKCDGGAKTLLLGLLGPDADAILDLWRRRQDSKSTSNTFVFLSFDKFFFFSFSPPRPAPPLSSCRCKRLGRWTDK